MRRSRGHGRGPVAADDKLLQPIKLRALDAAFERLHPDSFADLGGIWAVDAGYTLFVLNRFPVNDAVLVDTALTPAVTRQASREPRLRLVSGNFADPQVVARVGNVDVVLLFDVLLHQVKPDWDDVLRLYAPITRAFVIVNPQLVDASRTLRLLDLGKERYEQLVPRSPAHDEAWANLDRIHPVYRRPYRDIHEIWQWGIVDADLDTVCRDLGFELTYFENAGTWCDQERFEHHAFVYLRAPEKQSARIGF